MSLTNVPWDAIRRWYVTWKRQRFGRPRPEGVYIRVHATEEELLEALGGRSYAPNYELAYYMGEDLNLAQVVWHPISEWPEPVKEEMRKYADLSDPAERHRAQWWQTHGRGYKVRDGVWDWWCHWETEPSENDAAHLAEVGFAVGPGTENFLADVEDAGLEWEQIDYRRDDRGKATVVSTPAEDPRGDS